MKISTQDCKDFISENAHIHGVPETNWKRISKRKTSEGFLRIFSNDEGYEIEILEDQLSSTLKWLKTTVKDSKMETENVITNDNFNTLPLNVQLFINTLRSLQGSYILFEETFPKKYQKLWKQNIKDRNNSRTSDIFLFDSEGEEQTWDILHGTIDSSWNKTNIIKYVASYFSFAFINDTRDDEHPQMIIQPTGFYDDGRIPVIFQYSYIKHELLAGLSEIMESTIEFEPKIPIEDPSEKVIQAFKIMKEIGVELDRQLQIQQRNVDAEWIFELTDNINNIENKPKFRK